MTNDKIESIARECGLERLVEHEDFNGSLIVFANRIKEETIEDLMAPVNTSYGKPEDWSEE